MLSPKVVTSIPLPKFLGQITFSYLDFVAISLPLIPLQSSLMEVYSSSVLRQSPGISSRGEPRQQTCCKCLQILSNLITPQKKVYQIQTGFYCYVGIFRQIFYSFDSFPKNLLPSMLYPFWDDHDQGNITKIILKS